MDNIIGAVVAEHHVLQLHRAVLRMLGGIGNGDGSGLQHGVDAVQGVGYNKLIFTHVHDLGQGQGNHRSDDDVKQ